MTAASGSPPFRFVSLCAVLALGVIPLARGQVTPLEAVVVTALRAETAPDAQPFATRIFTTDTLRQTPTLALDDALRSSPSFGLFRRSDSLTAHPTAQGVSLRALGPSGASRSLVVLDGVPVNDPFGGWVTWTKLPRESLERVEIVSGGGATAWGNTALGGVVQLVSHETASDHGRVTALDGDFSTGSVEWDTAQTAGPGTLEVAGRVFTSSGVFTVAPESRGPVDQPANDRHRWFSATWRQAISATTTATLTGRWFREVRSNGTPYQRNSTEDSFFSARVASRPSTHFRWNTVAYAESEGFASTFGSVNATRTAESPASDQYSVPATALGAAWTGDWTFADSSRAIFGGDTRWTRGESRENVTYSSGQYTRNRVAGGRQDTSGVFVAYERPIATALVATVGSRLDYWQDAGGLRRERDRVSGVLLRDDHFADRDGWQWSPSAGLSWRATERLKLRVSGQRAYRRPTLNELYRPFRVGNVITEANPNLGTETVNTGEVGAEWAAGPWTAAVTGFWNELHGAVANVTVVRGPATTPEFGTIPAGGLGRRRMNLDCVRVRGFELSTRWQATRQLAFTADALINDAEVIWATAAPNLVGLRVAEVPRVSASVGALWHAGAWQISTRARWIGAQFEDDENLLRLAPALVADAGVNYRLTRAAELMLNVENLFNERVETGRSATGLINVAARRFATAGVRFSW